MKRNRFRVVQDGATAHVIIHGKVAFRNAEAKHLRAMAAALTQVAGLCEHMENPSVVISDQALMMRAGFPIGLTDNRDILREAHKVAETDTTLRRAHPDSSKGIPSDEVFGTPTIIREDPRKESIDG